MIRDVVEPNDPITLEDVEDFARRHRLELPASYWEFLLKHNGGRPIPPFFPIAEFPDNPVGEIQAFFGLRATIPTEDLDATLDELCDLLPKGVLPIACTGLGDYLCLDLRRPAGPVMFWDRKPSWGNNVWTDGDLYPVAPNFDSLLVFLQDADTERPRRG